MVQTLYWIFAILIFLCLGSFLNVVIYRYPKMLFKQWQEEAEQYLHPENIQDQSQPKKMSHKKIFNIAFPSSHCPSCEKPLSFWHNIPLLSYLFLKGRCYFCKTHISWQYPFVEWLTVILSAIILNRYGFNAVTVLPICATLILICLTMIDCQHQLLPDTFTYALLWLGLLQNTLFHTIPLSLSIYGALVGYLLLWVIGFGYKLIRKIDGIGHGDYKLLAAIGAWFGPYLVIITLSVASLISLMVGLILLATHKMNRETPMSFGPYLAMVAFVILSIGPNTLLGIIF
jgi:leader peptidase (prepilin peptidase)/N-methyltransferase